jgi:peptidoglycan/LPS O-acetylase OafA/YrhL
MLRYLKPGAFRLFLAFVVLVCHSTRFDLGAWAVYTFFVLSGFWIYRMWTEKYSKTYKPLRTFYISRLWRILPVFWLTNIVSSFALAFGLEPKFTGDILSRFTWLRSAFSNTLILGYADLPHMQGGLRVAWSLDVELQFYLVFPVLLYFCCQTRAGKYWKATLLGACAVGLVAFLAPSELGSRNLVCFGLFFLAGVTAAHFDWSPNHSTTTASLLIALAAILICWFHSDWRLLLENDKHGGTDAFTHYKRIAQAILALVSAPLALYTVRNVSDPRDRMLGEITYIVYLIHWPVMMAHSHYFEHLAPSQRIPSLVAAWVLIAILSLLVYHALDQPLERLRKRWVSGRLRPGYPVPPAGG